jgi:hypothetical protein
MTPTTIAAKFALPLAAVLTLLAGCQGVYVAGDAGPHASQASTRGH